MQDLFQLIPRAGANVAKRAEQLYLHDHICLLYRDSDESLVSAAAFIETGLLENDRCILVADDNDKGSFLSYLQKRGIDSDIEGNELVVADKYESYLEGGKFDPESAIDYFKQAAIEAKTEGFRAIRGVAEMTWQLGSEPGTDRLLEYESRMNEELFPKYSVLGMCQYNVTRFSADFMREVLFTHPVVIIGDLVCKNPYYQLPEDYLPYDDTHAENDIRQMVNRLLRNSG